MQRRGWTAPLVTAALLAGCGTTYDPVEAEQSSLTRPLAGDRDRLIRSARSVLQARGFGLTRSNTEAGVLATAWESRELTPTQADCGAGPDGQPYLAQADVRAEVAYRVRVHQSGNTITIQARVRGWAPDGSELDCRSTGELEHDLYRRIASKTGVPLP